MVGKKYIALILSVLVLVAEANNGIQKVPSPALSESRNWEGLGLTADVNKYVDETIHMVVPLMQAYGLDPMPLPDVEEGFEVRPVLITYSAWLRITQGRMTGLSSVSRSGDQMVNYFARMIRVRVVLQFRDLRFDYRYLVKVMNMGPTGGIVATLNRFVVITDVLLDFNNDEIHLQQFSLTDIGRLRVRLTGNVLTDWLVNPVITVFTSIFDNIIIKVVEINIRRSIQDVIDFMNTNLKAVIRYLESYN
ncbi:uncharacterized protein LOC113233193 isoform X1 [Hyposmocoma kahamanoa]|uniref:uncharacterized protein LOC113233193 isoform X1 n=1 Tax=Hyposmocoma kahamanoa TaxID=1477025 RepID=UPI000E6D60AD|nr:uncharacterized protein LOC113233193 isoform X1 [Hyposmocoma kahamanoa]